MKGLIQLGRELWNTPEPGFFEEQTGQILKTRFLESGFAVHDFERMPGFYAIFGKPADSGRYVVLADMDALPNPGTGGYIHSCGHHIQGTVLYGSAALLAEKNPDVLRHLVFAAVPAEEYIELDRRAEIAKKAGLSALSGKQELLTSGFFDRFEAVIATHAAAGKGRFITSVRCMNGFVVRNFNFTGLAAHAGAHPHKGRNAQNAASLFLQACAFLRETFEEEQHIRIHPVIRLRKDQSVNLIPDYAGVETYVRAASPGAVEETAEKLEAAARGCSEALGVQCGIERNEGYAPFVVNDCLHDMAKRRAEEMGVPFINEAFSAASSDVGDISQQKPAIIIGLPGNNGLFHNPEFSVTDEESAYVFSSEFLAAYLEDLVKTGLA